MRTCRRDKEHKIKTGVPKMNAKNVCAGNQYVFCDKTLRTSCITQAKNILPLQVERTRPKFVWAKKKILLPNTRFLRFSRFDSRIIQYITLHQSMIANS